MYFYIHMCTYISLSLSLVLICLLNMRSYDCVLKTQHSSKYLDVWEFLPSLKKKHSAWEWANVKKKQLCMCDCVNVCT